MNTIITNQLRPIFSFVFIVLFSKYGFELLVTKILEPPVSRDGLPFLWQILLLFVFPIVSYIVYWISLKINENNSLIISRINAIVLGSANMFYVLFLDSATLLALLCYGFCFILGLIEEEKEDYKKQQVNNRQIINTNENFKLYYKIMDNNLLRTIIAVTAIALGGVVLGYYVSSSFLAGAMIRGFSLFGVGTEESFFTVLKIGIIVSLPLISLAPLFKTYISQKNLKVALAVLLTFVFLIGPGGFNIMVIYNRPLMNFSINILVCLYLVYLFWLDRDTIITN